MRGVCDYAGGDGVASKHAHACSRSYEFLKGWDPGNSIPQADVWPCPDATRVASEPICREYARLIRGLALELSHGRTKKSKLTNSSSECIPCARGPKECGISEVQWKH